VVCGVVSHRSTNRAMATRVHEPEAPAAAASEPWTIEDSRLLYNTAGWGISFFDINDAGHVVVRPDRSQPERALDLFEIARDLEAQGVGLPLLLRFSDILRSRIASLSQRFRIAIDEFRYEGAY